MRHYARMKDETAAACDNVTVYLLFINLTIDTVLCLFLMSFLFHCNFFVIVLFFEKKKKKMGFLCPFEKSF